MIAYVFFKKEMNKPVDPDITLSRLKELVKIQGYALVAEVDLSAYVEPSVDVVWQSCNHIDTDWRDNDLVTYLVKEFQANCIRPDGCRSMCVGDIVVMGEDLYLCEPCGWKKMPIPDSLESLLPYKKEIVLDVEDHTRCSGCAEIGVVVPPDGLNYDEAHSQLDEVWEENGYQEGGFVSLLTQVYGWKKVDGPDGHVFKS